MAFFGVCILCEIFSYLKFNTDNYSLRGLVYHSLIFPCGLQVFATFWVVYLTKSRWGFTEIRTILPLHINHILHTLLLPALLIEGTLYYHPLPPRKAGLRLLWLFLASYGVYVTFLGFSKGYWVYPLLQHLPLLLKFGLMACWAFGATLLYLMGERFHKYVWRQHLKDQ
jgi:hypothetical protein